jgi:hypothetical protein
MRPSLGVHTLITNPLSSGYLSYLPAITSWASLADEVVVIDGGSTDESIPVLLDWLGPLKTRVRIVASKERAWGPGDWWAWPQIAVNRESGFRLLETDWAVHVDADHVVEPADGDTLRRELGDLSDELVVNLQISAGREGRYVPTQRKRAWVVSKHFLSRPRPPIGYGMEGTGPGLDYPIYQATEEQFVDPWTGMTKRVSRGAVAPAARPVSSRVRRIGHFFFTRDQCLAKCQRNARAVSRYTGSVPLRTLELIAMERLYGVAGFRSKQDLIEEEPNGPIRQAISAFYQEGMLGGALTSWRAAALKPAVTTLAVAARGLRLVRDWL